jgi:hypothetical protein
MTLRRVGYFKELPHGDPEGPALSENIDRSHQESDARIVRYLARGNVLATAPMTTYDVLGATGQPIGTLQIMTDGTWEWPSDLGRLRQPYDGAGLGAASPERDGAH